MTEQSFYMRVVEGFRTAKNVGEINVHADKYKDQLLQLKDGKGEYDLGTYNAIRHAYKYYVDRLQRR